MKSQSKILPHIVRRLRVGYLILTFNAHSVGPVYVLLESYVRMSYERERLLTLPLVSCLNLFFQLLRRDLLTQFVWEKDGREWTGTVYVCMRGCVYMTVVIGSSETNVTFFSLC